MKFAKKRYPNQRTVRITWEPDYDDSVWEEGEGAEPTPETHPDAFYMHVTPAHPRPPKASTRKQPPEKLSRTALRKRLSNAGFQGAELRRLVAEIATGPTTLEGTVGHMAGNWNVGEFRKRFGARVARAVLRFLRMWVCVLDEGWQMMSAPGTSEFIRRAFMAGRKYGATMAICEGRQTAEALAGSYVGRSDAPLIAFSPA